MFLSFRVPEEIPYPLFNVFQTANFKGEVVRIVGLNLTESNIWEYTIRFNDRSQITASEYQLEK